ncbi:MAG: hypothetical protein MJ094_06290 [Saccharofermentans sp.]|nr:hypothetical protein [Saccharofermentans sp.]
MDKIKRIWNVVWCYILAVILGFPHFLMSCYSIPGADDFSCLNAVDIYRENHSYIVSAILYARDAYLTWQGTYTGEFLMGLEPSVRNSYLGLRVFLAFSVIIFIAGLLLTTYMIARKLFALSRNVSWAFALICEFIALNITATGELFSWYTGAAVYTIPLASYLLALPFSVLSYYTGKRVFAVLTAVFGFIGSGGSLMVVGFGCSAYLVLVIFYAYVLKPKKNNYQRFVKLVVPFVVTVLGALICALAPGNFVRQGGEMHLVQSVYYSGVNVLTHVAMMILNYLLPLCFVICFIIGLVAVRREFTKENLFVGILGFCFITCVTAFPVILGYDSYCFEAYVRSDRVLYVIDFLICTLALVLSLVLGSYIRCVLQKHNIDVNREMIKSIPIIVIVFVLLSNGLVHNFFNGMTMRILDDLKNERIQNVSIAQEDIYREIAGPDPQGDNVAWVLRPQFPETVMYVPFYSFAFDYFSNQEVSEYYGVDAFIMEWT